MSACVFDPSKDEATVTLANLIRRNPNLVKNRTYNFKKYQKVLVGKELVNWLVEQKVANTREEAIVIGKGLIDNNYIHHVHDDHVFKDDFLFYRFREDEKAEGPSAIEVSKCALLKGTLLKKGQLRWNERYFALKQDEGKLYYFDAETSSSPRDVIDLKDKVRVRECIDCKSGMYCFDIVTKDKIHTICAEKSKIQEEWIQGIIETGANFMEDDSLGTIAAKSLYEFKCLDIDKNEVDLTKYNGKVCLIVNVASF